MSKIDGVLRLTLKKKWYDTIDQGKKTEEYREYKPYWIGRLCNRYMSFTGGVWNYFPAQFDRVVFTEGYAKNARQICFEVKSISVGKGKPEWGAPADEDVFIIKLGKRL